MKREGYIIILVIVLILVVLSLTSPDFVKKMTGFATSDTVDINISVSGNNIPNVTVYNSTITDVSGGPNEATNTTTLVINFTVYDADGFGNINDSTASVSFNKTGETSRSNTSCENLGDYATYYTNYTCNVTMWWWDGSGLWSINASITDNDDNANYNGSQNFYLGTTDGATMSPTTLTWGSITAGATNEEPNENITLNNTGNVDKNIEINATNLRGETDSDLALWANNFTANNATGCEGTAMVEDTFTAVTNATLPAGNYTLNYNNATSGQEQTCFCLEQAGSELIAQAYSTANETDWTIRVV